MSLHPALVFATVYEHWLETGRPMTRKELAAAVGLARLPRGCDPEDNAWLDLQQVEQPKYSRDYPGVQVGTVMVDGFLPTRHALRDKLRRYEQAEG